MPQESPAIESQTAASVVVKTVRSDELLHLARLVKSTAAFKDGAEVFQVDVILDANVVLQDVMWMCRKRKNPEARPNLLELLDCKVVRAHAPTFLLKEIAINLPRLATQHRLSEEAMNANWERIRALINFVDVGEPDITQSAPNSVRDPKDLPYIRLQQLIDAPIATKDKDVSAMGGKVVQIQIFGPLKSYSRNAAVEYRIKTLGIGSVLLGLLALSGLFACSKIALKSVRRIPPPLLFVGSILAVVAVAHPDSRKRLWELLQRLAIGAKGVAATGLSALLPFIDEHYTAQQSARIELERAKVMLEQRRAETTAP